MTHDARSALLYAALEAAERGWPVLLLHPHDKRPAGHAEKYCPRTGRCVDGHKTPEQRATTDTALLTAAWAQRPYNVGIATGPSGLLVVDLDTLKPEDPKGTPDGATSFAALCERAEQTVPDTYRVRTARGGEHLYFTQPPESGCTTPPDGSRRRSTPAGGAGTSSPPAAPPRTAPTRSSTTGPRPCCPTGYTSCSSLAHGPRTAARHP